MVFLKIPQKQRRRANGSEFMQTDGERLKVLDNSFAIAAHNLQRSFGGLLAVKNFSAEVKRGEMFGIVGPDSAGKSTVIRLLCGLIRPTGGSAKILGFDLLTEPKKVKSRIGYLSQDFTLYGDLTVEENIGFFARLHNVKDYKKRSESLLRFTRLERFKDRLAQYLSGGMKKKLALACTLIHTPEIIFLDEPSTGVDPVSRGEFWNILSEILQEGVTIVMTTPYLDEAERCHSVALMYRGEVVITGTPAQVKSSMPGKVYDIVCPDLNYAYQLLKRRFSNQRVVLYGDRLRFLSMASTEDEIREAMKIIDENISGSSEFYEAEPTFEDAFIALTFLPNNPEAKPDLKGGNGYEN